MRKIISKYEKEKRAKIKQVIVGAVLVLIMVLSTLGYAFQGGNKETTTKINYNGHEFVNQNDFWILSIGNFYFAFKNNPSQVEKIYSQLNSINNYLGKPLYVYSEDKKAEIEIYRNLDPKNNLIAQRIQPACLNREECVDESFPIKTCADNFIIIKEAESSTITQENNCVFISGPKENLEKITDEFLFKILGIE
jgi:hypothetical protein